jgi:PIN domain nuclease of toxin-antitoxin system
VNVLLDTCTFLWIVLEPARLSADAMRLFTDPANHCSLSVVSAWEIAVKYALGRLPLQQPPHVFVPAQRVQHGIDLLTLSEEAALQVANLPRLHKDPFDRMLISQALVHGLVILTPDADIRQYPTVQTMW